MKKAVFLDRDGTIIVDKIYLNDPQQIEYFPKAIEAMKAISDKGFLLLVATNQSGIPRGLVTEENLKLIHDKISEEIRKFGVEIAHYYYAPHLVESNHELRKPNPGMLLQGQKDFDIDMSASWMIGDKMTDVEAGHRAGTKSIYIEGFEDPTEFDFAPPEHTVKSLWEAVEFIH